MVPITLLALQKVSQLVTTNDALEQAIQVLNQQSELRIPILKTKNITLNSASQDIGDRNVQLTYPRICLSVDKVRNLREEKFRSFSGTVSVSANILASGDLVTDAEGWVHYYVDVFTEILSANLGDWGDGIFYGGLYDVQFTGPRVGGFGFVVPATVTFTLFASRE